eukprot:3381444-Pyramimonas_sp.AAC.1
MTKCVIITASVKLIARRSAHSHPIVEDTVALTVAKAHHSHPSARRTRPRTPTTITGTLAS